MSISRTIAKNTFFNFIITATDVAVAFFVSILLARGLGADEYGQYTFLMWFLSLGALVANLGLGEMARRYIAEATGRGDKETPAGIIKLSLVIRGSVTIFVALLIVGISGYLTKVFDETSSSVYFMLVALALFPNVMSYAMAAIFAGFQKYEYAAYIGLITSPLRLVGIIVMLALGYGVAEILIMTAVIWFIGIFISIFFVRRLVPLRKLTSKTHLEPAIKKDAIKYSMNLMGIQGVNYFIWSQAEVLFLGLYCTMADIAYYNLAFKIPRMVISLIPFVFGRVLLPTVAEQYGRGDMENVKTIYITSARYLMMLTFPLVVGGIALAAPIINVLYGAEYQPSIVLMQIIFVPFSTMGLTHASTSIIYGINQPSFILKTGMLAVIVGIGLYLWIIPRYGVIGAAIAGSIPRIAVFFLYNYYVYRRIGVHWPIGDSIRIILAAVIMGAVVYAVQRFSGDIPSLAIGIPLGILIYFTALIFLRFITPHEISLLRKVEQRLPVSLRSKYASVIKFLGTCSRKDLPY